MSQSGKSKLPDFKEVTGMASKLFTDVKTSITEIIEEYKTNRHEQEAKDGASTNANTSNTQSSTDNPQTHEQPNSPPPPTESSSTESSSETSKDNASKPE
ncbi:MAG: hypothetical protein GKR77_07420 [Legionellales bacterium]|nr:hypothetical protein [Legionellales bacterium]